jgi:lysophospholipase L1-like esterase
MKKIIKLLLVSIVAIPLYLKAQTRVVCVGNSVTAGYTLADASTQAWPAQLSALLGNKYVVYNCGVSGTTMLKKGASPYWNTSTFTTAKNYDPQILIISLGTNDSHPDNWQYKADFINDYSAMIDAFRQNGRNPAVFVVYPVACYADATQISNLQNEVIPDIAKVAAAKNASIINFNTPTQNKRNTLYNDNLHPNAAGAALLGSTAYNTITPTVPTLYSSCAFSGYGIKLAIGSYSFAALSAKGMLNDDISAIKVPAGYKLTVYADDNFTGSSAIFSSDVACLADNGWDNKISSVKITANGVTGKNQTYIIKNRNSGLVMDVSGGNATDGTSIIQWGATGGLNQRFTFTETANGSYKIINVATGKCIDVSGASTNNSSYLLEWTYQGNLNQEFIILAADNNYFKFKAAHSGRLVEVFGGGTAPGDKIDQYDDNNQAHAQWMLTVTTQATNTSLSSSKGMTITDEGNSASSLMYPNPANRLVKFKGIPANTEIIFLDIFGNIALTVKSSPADEGSLVDISRLKKGTYIVKISSRTPLKLIKE